MIRLGHQDFTRVAEFLRELYAQTDAAHWSDTMLAGLARLIPCEDLGYNEIHSRTNQVTMVIRPWRPRVFELAPALEAHFHEHPLLAYFRAKSDRRTCQFSDFLSARQFRQTGLYQEFYRHIGTHHQMAVALSERGATVDIGIAISRHHRGFSERDRTVLDALRPHFIQARANAQLFTTAEQQTRALAGSLASLDASVVVLHADGRVAWLTPRALALLDHFFPETALSATRLPEPLARWWSQVHAQAQSSGALAETQTPFTQALPGCRLTVQGQTGPDGSHRLLLTEERKFSLAACAQQSGLTRREIEVLHWLAEGKNNPEIAAILGISLRTVHKHVEHVLRKLDVESRHAATLKVLDWKQGR